MIKNCTSPKGKGFTAVITDISNFKSINEKLGHEEGDLAIKILAEILLEVFHDSTVIGRYGGNEFCVLSNTTDEAIIQDDLYLIRTYWEAAKSEHKWGDDIGISCSFEIFNPEDGVSAEVIANTIYTLMSAKLEHHSQ